MCLSDISSFGSSPASPLSATVITLSPPSAILGDAVNRDAAKMANEVLLRRRYGSGPCERKLDYCMLKFDLENDGACSKA